MTRLHSTMENIASISMGNFQNGHRIYPCIIWFIGRYSIKFSVKFVKWILIVSYSVRYELIACDVTFNIFAYMLDEFFFYHKESSSVSITTYCLHGGNISNLFLFFFLPNIFLEYFLIITFIHNLVQVLHNKHQPSMCMHFWPLFDSWWVMFIITHFRIRSNRKLWRWVMICQHLNAF